MSGPTIAELEILPDEMDQSRAVYAARVAKLLPNFPEEVLRTWFCEHPNSMRTFHPLGFENFRFEAVRRTTVELGQIAVLRTGSVLPALLADIPTTHLRLKGYWDRNGLWPVPPIMLDVESSTIPTVFGHALQSPYHLLEGYHRMALAIDFDLKASEPIERDYWMVRIDAPSAAADPIYRTGPTLVD